MPQGRRRPVCACLSHCEAARLAAWYREGSANWSIGYVRHFIDENGDRHSVAGEHPRQRRLSGRAVWRLDAPLDRNAGPVL